MRRKHGIQGSQHKGFTIIEVVLVLAIAGLIFLVVFAGASAMQHSQRMTQAKRDIELFESAIVTARHYQKRTLREITGSGCTRCVGTQGAYEQALNRISAAGNIDIRHLSAGDPWGNMYWLDENEGEQAANYCRRDSLSVVGQNTLWRGIEYYNQNICGP